MLAPVAVAYLAVRASRGEGTFSTDGAGHAALLASSGVVTVIPLLLFAGAAPQALGERLVSANE